MYKAHSKKTDTNVLTILHWEGEKKRQGRRREKATAGLVTIQKLARTGTIVACTGNKMFVGTHHDPAI